MTEFRMIILLTIALLIFSAIVLYNLYLKAEIPTSTAKVEKKDNGKFVVMQLYINKRRKYYKVEVWKEVQEYPKYEQARSSQMLIEQIFNRSTDNQSETQVAG